MKAVYQTIYGSGGNCWQAVVASLLDLELDQVPHFVSFPNSFEVHDAFLLEHGYANIQQIVNPRRLKHYGDDLFDDIAKYTGINGLFKACVYSPGMFTADLMCSDNEPTHAVIINKSFEIVHDPNINYAGATYPLASVLGYNGIISFDCITKKP